MMKKYVQNVCKIIKGHAYFYFKNIIITQYNIHSRTNNEYNLQANGERERRMFISNMRPWWWKKYIFCDTHGIKAHTKRAENLVCMEKKWCKTNNDGLKIKRRLQKKPATTERHKQYSE